MPDRQPIEYSGSVLDQRNDLTGPADKGKASYPQRPQHVSIQQSPNKNKQ